MGRFLAKQKEAANDALLNLVSSNDKLDSVKEMLTMMGSLDDEKTFAQNVDARITAALASGGSIANAISEGATSGISAALEENGAIASAISSGVGSGITAAIGEGGAVETWADGRYEPKTTVAAE